MTRPKDFLKLANRKHLRVAGLMSGTSADGIDVAIVDLAPNDRQLVGHATRRYPAAVRSAVLRLCDQETSRVADICHYNFVLGHFFARALIETCRECNISLQSIDLIGSHGQTIYHMPMGRRYGRESVRSTLQIGEPSVIAEMTGITTVADFRPRDIACGGQGAPLVPFADYVLFRHPDHNRAVQNIGGISNVTWIPAAGRADDILAFDCGPGNMVIDAVVSIATRGKNRYDRHGAIARRGRISDGLLRKSLKHPFFHHTPPKTTGREEFGLAYSRGFYDTGLSLGLEPADIVATATALTARTITESYQRFLPVMPDQVILCGGGVRNHTLVRMLADHMEGAELLITNDLGIDADAKEAVSFAILAWASIQGIANNVPSATGAVGPAILGKIVPAGFASNR